MNANIEFNKRVLETIKELSDMLLGIANKIKLLGSEFNDSKFFEINCVSIIWRYEAGTWAKNIYVVRCYY